MLILSPRQHKGSARCNGLQTPVSCKPCYFKYGLQSLHEPTHRGERERMHGHVLDIACGAWPWQLRMWYITESTGLQGQASMGHEGLTLKTNPTCSSYAALDSQCQKPAPTFRAGHLRPIGMTSAHQKEVVSMSLVDWGYYSWTFPRTLAVSWCRNAAAVNSPDSCPYTA